MPRGNFLPGWSCLEYISLGGGIVHRKFQHGGALLGKNSPVRIFGGSSFLLGDRVFAGKRFHGGRDFRQDLKNNIFK